MDVIHYIFLGASTFGLAVFLSHSGFAYPSLSVGMFSLLGALAIAAVVVLAIVCFMALKHAKQYVNPDDLLTASLPVLALVVAIGLAIVLGGVAA